MAVPKLPAKGMTYAEYFLLPDDGNKHEVLEGALTVSPAPRPRHQDIVVRLVQILGAHIQSLDLGKIYVAPVDVILNPYTIVQPDVLFVSHANMDIITDDNLQGPPDLCIEVLSPSSGPMDRYVKKDLYADFGVREYWIVDPIGETITIYRLEDGVYVPHTEATGDDIVSSAILTGFHIAAQAIFS